MQLLHGVRMQHHGFYAKIAVLVCG